MGRSGARRLAAPGPWPKVSVWHGAADSTVKPINADEIVKQWTDVHGISAVPDVEDTVDGYLVAPGAAPTAGTDRVYSITGMAHGAPIATGGLEGCGKPAPFINDVGISSTYHIARFWGLTERADRKPRRSWQPPRQRAAGHRKPEPRLSSPRPPPTSPPETGKAVILVDGAGRARAEEERFDQRSDTHWDRRSQEGRSHRKANRAEAGPPGPVDVQAILAKSFELAGIAAGTERAASARAASVASTCRRSSPSRSSWPGWSPSRAKLRPSRPPDPLGQRPSRRRSTARPRLRPMRPQRPSRPRRPTGITSGPATAASRHLGSLAGSGWEADGWELVADNATPVLFGYASSGAWWRCRQQDPLRVATDAARPATDSELRPQARPERGGEHPDQRQLHRAGGRRAGGRGLGRRHGLRRGGLDRDAPTSILRPSPAAR